MLYIYCVMGKFLLVFFCSILLFSCKQTHRKDYINAVVEWKGKEIIYPDNMIFTLWGQDTLDYSMPHTDYTIVNYVDSIGCLSCKLQLLKWKSFMSEIFSVSQDSVPVVFFFHPNDVEEITYRLKFDKYNYPVCIDLDDEFNKLNHFSADPTFQTFLLNKDNRVLAVGNPVHNPKVKELYLKIIRGENVSQEEETPRAQTTVEADRTEADMDRFDWREEQTAEFVLKNTGDSPLVILDTHTSCGCTQAEYDGKPVLPGDSLVLRVTYKADQPGYFRKEVTVRSNAEQELLKLIVTGEAEERKG
mgnify:CR=1 FL=1